MITELPDKVPQVSCSLLHEVVMINLITINFVFDGLRNEHKLAVSTITEIYKKDDEIFYKTIL